MAEGIKKYKKYESVRCRPNHKERIEKVIHTMAIQNSDRVTEVGLMTEILERELPRYEKKLGI